MSRSARQLKLVAAFCGLAVLTGCAAQADLAKTAGPRTTVPAPSNDLAFAGENLRVVDPCQLLDQQVLGSIGNPKPGELGDYTECRSEMSDKDGREMTVILTLDDQLINPPTERSPKLAGMSSSESVSGDSCFETVLTDPDNDLGITVQLSYPDGDPCPPARKVLESVVNRIRTNAPKYPETKGSLVALDPCKAVDDTVAADALGASVKKKYLWSLHECAFQTSGSVEFRVRYQIADDPKSGSGSTTPPTPVDIGGVTAYQDSERAADGQCSVEWQRRALRTDGENVKVTFDGDPPPQGQDPCAKAVTVAKAVQAKLGAA